MSTSEPQERELSQGEELVAYLDGELPPEVTRQVEERLASDADYMQQLRELDQAWEALDVLPRAVADDDFARTTIEMVAQKAQLDLSQRVAEVAQVERRSNLRWFAAAAVVAVTSFVIARMTLPNADDRLVEHLPVIREVDFWDQVTDIEFLRELASRVNIDDLKRNEVTFERELNAIRATSAPPAERKQWVQNLSSEEKEHLWAQQDRYFTRTEEDQTRLTELHDQLASDKESEKLHAILIAYSQWLGIQRENFKAELRDESIPAETRVAQVLNRLRFESSQRARTLSEAERGKVREEIRLIYLDHKDAVLEFVRNPPAPRGNDGRGSNNRNDDADDRKARDERESLEREQFRKDTVKRLEEGGAPAQLLTVWWALHDDSTGEVTRTRLIDKLEKESQDYLSERGNRNQDLLRFCVDSLPRLQEGVGSNALMRFFATEIDNEERKRLLQLPYKDFDAQLRRQFIDQAAGVEEMSRLMGIPGLRGQGGRGRGGGNFGNEPPPPRGGRGGRSGPPPDGPDRGGFNPFGDQFPPGPPRGGDGPGRDDKGI